MKNKLFNSKKTNTQLPVNYYYLTALPRMQTGEIKVATIPKKNLNSRASILTPFYKPISIDFMG